MFSLKDLLAVLDRWDVWQRVSATPDKIEALERRVAALEEKLGDVWPADVCRACGKRAMRLGGVRGPGASGTMTEHWDCAECGGHERRQVKPR